MAKLLHILVEQVISFEMSGQTSKSDKNCLEKWANSDRTMKTCKHAKVENFTKSLILGSRDSFSSNFNIFEKNNSNCLMLQAVTCKFWEMCPVSAPIKFFSFWHYIPLENHWIDHSYQFWLPNPYTRRAVALQRPFHDFSIYEKTVNCKNSWKVPFGR